MHTCRFARGRKWGGKEVVDSEACGLFAGDIESEAETWCKRGTAGEEGKKGPLAGRGGREPNERLKPTYSKNQTSTLGAACEYSLRLPVVVCADSNASPTIRPWAWDVGIIVLVALPVLVQCALCFRWLVRKGLGT